MTTNTLSLPVTTTAVSGGLYTLPVDPKWYSAHPEWFTSPTPAGGPVAIPVPAKTPVLSATAGTVTSVTPGGACRTGVIVTGSDGAAYSYCQGQNVGVQPGQQVTAGQQLLVAGATGFTFEMTVPDVAAPLCVQPALGSWAAGVDIDVHALPVSQCGSPAAPPPTTPPPSTPQVAVVADPATAGVASQVSQLLTDEGLHVQVVNLPTALNTVPAVNWPAAIATPIAASHASWAVVVAGLNGAPAEPALADGTAAVLAALSPQVHVVWAHPGAVQPAPAPSGTASSGQAASQAPDPAIAALIASHPNLRVETVDPMTVSPGGAPATGAAADQAEAGAVTDYVDSTQQMLGASRLDWATAFATRIGATNPAAVNFIMAWTTEEGASPWANNPLNSSLAVPGASPLAGNPDGVKVYPSVLTGLDADTSTLLNGPAYQSVIAALRSGNVAQAAAALQASPWCVGSGGGQCPAYGAMIAALVSTYQDPPTLLAAENAPVGSVLTPMSVPPGAPANFGPVWQFLVAQLGKPYQWGGAGPNSWDCSGLVMAAYAQAGVPLVHYAASQYQETASTAVKGGIAALQPGDLVFWAYSTNDASTIHHVAVYIGGGQVLDAFDTGTNVQIQPLWTSGLYGVTRPLG